MGSRADVSCSEKSGGVGSFALGTAFAFPAEPASRGGAFAASPRGPPYRKPQRIYIVKERGTLCAQMTEGCAAAPLSHYFSAPRFGAGKI